MVKIIIGGDFCPHKEEKSLEKFAELSELFRSVDYSIVNLECPIDRNHIYKPIRKIGPNLISNILPTQILRPLGISAVTLANNHFRDYGNDCCNNTINLLKESKIDVVGAGSNIDEARLIFFKTIKDTTIAIVNSCENEFSIATKSEAGSNPISSIRQYYDIQEARKKADIVIVIVHGGVEMYNLPTPKMQERYRFFIDCGADIVINHHQHCYSGMETYKGKHIYYGIGNLYFPKIGDVNNDWSQGFLVKVCIENKSIIDFSHIPYTQSYEKGIEIGDNLEFNDKFKRLSEICGVPESVEKQYIYHCLHDADTYNFINPYNNRILRGLARRGYIPSFISKKSFLELLCKIRCESHYDKFVQYIERRYLK